MLQKSWSQSSDATGRNHRTEIVLERIFRLIFSESPGLFVAHTWKAGLLTLATALLAFGYELTNPTLGIDDYIHLHVAFKWDEFWISRGMWGGLLLKALAPGEWITPFISLFMGIILQVLAGLVVLWTWRLDHSPSFLPKFIVPAFLVCFPYFAAQMAFSYLQVDYPLATLFMALGTGLLVGHRPSVIRHVLAVLLIVCGVSIYQGSLSILGTLLILTPVMRTLTVPPGSWRVGRAELAAALRVLGTVAAAGAFYYGLHQIIMALTAATPESTYYSVSLQPNFWNRFPDLSANSKFLLFGGRNLIPMGAVFVFMTAYACLLFFVAKRSISTRKPAGLYFFVLLLMAPVAPFCVSIAHAAYLAPRSSLGIALLWCAAFAGTAVFLQKTPRKVLAFACAVILYGFIVHINGMFYAQFLVSRADAVMTAAIVERAQRLLPSQGTEKPVIILMAGSYSHPQRPHRKHFTGSVLGYSNFEWGQGQPGRIEVLADSLGLNAYAWCKADAALEQVLREEKRPSWPHRDAMFLRNGQIVLWLGSSISEPYKSRLEEWMDGLINRSQS